jgi:RNA polymerase sigma factor (sigma-70 family)
VEREGRQSTAVETGRLGLPGSRRPESDAARKRAAVEMIAEHGASLKRTARRYSLDAEDAEDAYQRALEIALTKAPSTDSRELIRWTQTVTKHEALAVRQGRERLLGKGGRGDNVVDPVAMIPAAGDGPDEQAERREAMARSREALRALKPAELRALSLLAEGYSYAEIGELTGFSQTKINRVLSEGRDRFRSLVSSSEDGSRCRALRPLLSAFCDDEVSSREAETVREHLRACAHCRSTMRTYRAAPRIAIALTPVLLPSRSLLERARELIDNLGSRLPGIGASDSAAQIAAAGGSKGAGMATIAKLLALCAGGAAACVATGVLPAPDLAPQHSRPPTIERSVVKPIAGRSDESAQDESAPAPPSEAQPKAQKETEAQSTNAEASETTAGAVEYEPAPAPAPPPPAAPAPAIAPTGDSTGSAPSSGSAAGEFGP